MKKLVDIYRSGKKEGLYLYVNKGQDLDELPSALMKTFGQAELAMSIVLSEEKKLARVDINDVLAALEDTGFFLQMPPQPGTYEEI